jgi:hypothetical protein
MGTGRWFFVVAGSVMLALLVLAIAYPFNENLDVERPLALEEAGADAVTFELKERNDSAQFGFATLDPVSDRETKIGLELGAPIGLPQTAHVHAGSCRSVDATVLRELEPLIQKNPRLATSTSTIDVALADLQSGDFVIDVHQRERESRRVACGEIPE